ncbi:MAG: choice-of-anchor M domain-containing protein [Verrucomicrobiota bacterium]
MNFLTKSAGRILLACLLGVSFNADAQIIDIDHQHADFRLQYLPTAEGTNRLDIILGYDTGTEHLTATNQQVCIVGGPAAKLFIPSNPDYAFLGAPGAPVWILPQSQNLSLPYLGTSAEDIPLGVFDGPLNLELRSVEGPGNFFAWANTGAGQPPIIKFICTNGVVATNFNVMNPFTGSHEHYNWGFSTNGLYRITYRVTGRRLGETTNIIGKDVAWAFQILPLRPWEEWVSTNWLPATGTNITGAGADPDGDGTVNLLEYAFGNDPRVALATNAPVVTFVNDNGTNYGALSYRHATNATDVSFEVRADDTPVWLTETLTNIAAVITLDGAESVTVRDSTPREQAPHRFYQLRVRLNYP